MPIGFIPRMASKVGTAVCGTACTVVCEVAWGTNPHAPTRLLPQQSNYYGEGCQFLHGYQKACDHSCLETLTYYLANIYNKVMSRPQNWSRMIQNTVFMAHKDTANLSTKTCISQTTSVNAQCARQWRVVPLGQA